MKIEQLEYLVYFAQAGSVSAAASHFYMTKQGMNKALHQLERDSGYVLFEGDSNGLRLTRAGEEFARNAASIVESYHDLEREMCAFSETPDANSKPAVTVAATPAAMRYLVPLLGLQNPGLFPFEVLLREMNQHEMSEALCVRRKDKMLGLFTIPVREKYEARLEEALSSKGQVFDLIGESPVYALVSSSSKLAQLKTFDIEHDIEGQKVGYLADEMLRDALDDYVRDEDVRTVTGNIDLLDDQIANNRLITFAPGPRLIAKRPPVGITPVPCSGDVRIRYGLVRTVENQDDPSILQIMTRVMSTLGSGVFK